MKKTVSDHRRDHLTAGITYANYSVSDQGEWPTTWPKAPKPFVNKRKTLTGSLEELRHYAIPFTDGKSLSPHGHTF